MTVPLRCQDLALGDRLGRGGQGAVWEVNGRLINRTWQVVFKEYTAECRAELRGDALDAQVEFLPGLPLRTGQWLSEHTAWPAAAVADDDGHCGFLMRRLPEEYFFDLSTGDRKPAALEFLLNNESYQRRIGLHVTDLQRLQLLLDLAGLLDRLHGLGVVVGDLSPKNVLFRLAPAPGCFLIDCDAMRVEGRDALVQRETPDWAVPTGEELATVAADGYKFGLLALRLFARDQATRDAGALAGVSPALGRLARLSQSGPDLRPGLGQWAEALGRAIAAPAAPKPPKPAAPPTAPSPPTAPKPSAAPKPPTAPKPPKPAAPPAAPKSPTAPTIKVTVPTPPMPPVRTVPAPPKKSRAGGRLAALLSLAVLAFFGYRAYVAYDAEHTGPSAPPSSGPTEGTSHAVGAGRTGTPAAYDGQARSQAAAVDALLNGNAGNRDAVTQAVSTIDSCAGSDAVSAAVSTLNSAAQARLTLAQRLASTDTSQLADLGQRLSDVLRFSAAADTSFAGWGNAVAAGTADCSSGTAAHTADWDQAMAASRQATAAKQSFTDGWNPLAARYGLATRDPAAL
ncbi:hypothetical protein LN042_28365 [Kitasatospora sp. RB6PN24]|uniref:hypothetical protein n=1 Tax=Kitasatospora humi TaxID=2893891 RepID=UPI001E416B5D|nr:hypothetical protein [Kitasatospora humi]MCC9310938.1 hypothetical protein [Kitasatospora humi]